MSKQAFYHQAGLPPKPCFVINESNGKVDLAEDPDKEPFVISCEVLDHPLPGHATLVQTNADAEHTAINEPQSNEPQSSTAELPSLLQMGAENAAKGKAQESKKK